MKTAVTGQKNSNNAERKYLDIVEDQTIWKTFLIDNKKIQNDI